LSFLVVVGGGQEVEGGRDDAVVEVGV